jgi:RNA polymerase sigma-70 factor (ECF subfamily)
LVDKESRFRALFSENYRHLARYARHRGLNAEESDDLVASTFEVVWRRFESIPDGDQAVLWLYGIAFNQLRNLRRTKRRQTRLATRVLPVTSMSDSAEPSDIPIETIRAALEALAFEDREVILLVAGEGLSADEVGVVLGCGGATARSRLHRARKRLAIILEEANNAQRSRAFGHVPNEHGEATEVSG